MFKQALLIAAVFAAVSTGLAAAQETSPATGKLISPKKLASMRIIYLKDRIQNQRDRISRYLTNHTLTGAQADSSRMLLDSVVNKMKAEHQANGPMKTISKEIYQTYNATLDTNSAMLNEQKKYFYYYGSYAEEGPYYQYYYDAYPAAVAPTPSVIHMAEAHPMIYELKDRVKNQRERIQQGRAGNLLTGDQAKDCGVILNAVQNEMKDDYKTNGSQTLTEDQYLTLNNALDVNSKTIQENKHLFYYYDNVNEDHK